MKPAERVTATGADMTVTYDSPLWGRRRSFRIAPADRHFARIDTLARTFDGSEQVYPGEYADDPQPPYLIPSITPIAHILVRRGAATVTPADITPVPTD